MLVPATFRCLSLSWDDARVGELNVGAVNVFDMLRDVPSLSMRRDRYFEPFPIVSLKLEAMGGIPREK